MIEPTPVVTSGLPGSVFRSLEPVDRVRGAIRQASYGYSRGPHGSLDCWDPPRTRAPARRWLFRRPVLLALAGHATAGFLPGETMPDRHHGERRDHCCAAGSVLHSTAALSPVTPDRADRGPVHRIAFPWPSGCTGRRWRVAPPEGCCGCGRARPAPATSRKRPLLPAG